MEKVYYIDDALKGLRNKRIHPMYTTAESILTVVFCFLLGIQSFSEHNYRLEITISKILFLKR